MEALDLEQMASNMTDVSEEQRPQTNTNNSKKEVNYNQSLFKEMETIYKLPFKVAMQNLKLKEEDVLDVGRQLFEKGFFEKEFNLPFNVGTIKLRSKKVLDELDYYRFLEEALSKNVTIDEFNFLTSVRNLALVLVKYKDQSFEGKTLEEKIDFLNNLSTPLVMSLTNLIQPFWSLMMISMHKDFVVFLLKRTQQQ